MISHSPLSNSLQPHGLQSARLFCPWGPPGKNTGTGCHFLLQGNLPNPGIEPVSPAASALAGRFLTTSTTWEAPSILSLFHTLQKKKKITGLSAVLCRKPPSAGFPDGTGVRNPPANTGVEGDSGSILGEGRWQPTPVFLPGESHGQRSLGVTVHGVTESETT